eukprot:m.103682 g.103682  ORF g.103682 m.103682 type:complete len:125 (+) comp9099_c0_seq1:29-403(+)
MSSQLPSQTQAQLVQISTSEKLADSIITTKNESSALENRLNQNRVAIRAIKKQEEEKSWLLWGSTNQFFSFPKEGAVTILQKDQTFIEERKDEVRQKLKDEVEQLQKIRGEPLNSGFNLSGVHW